MKFELLGKMHDRNDFGCREPALTHYLQNYALQDQKRGLSRVHVLVNEQHPQRILGFYTLSMDSISTENFPIELSKPFGNRSFLPVALLGRMATNGNYKEAYQAEGLQIGRLLMANCIQRAF